MPSEPPAGAGFDLEQFLPYLLNQAAEAISRSFQATYRTAYGMSRTEWRVLANLGRFGAMSARDICNRSHLEKTKVSRAVAALETGGLLARAASAQDRRVEVLTLTDAGLAVFADLGAQAVRYDADLRRQLGAEDVGRLDRLLRQLIARSGPPAPGD